LLLPVVYRAVLIGAFARVRVRAHIDADGTDVLAAGDELAGHRLILQVRARDLRPRLEFHALQN